MSILTATLAVGTFGNGIAAVNALIHSKKKNDIALAKLGHIMANIAVASGVFWFAIKMIF
ncbi:hypothetical protein SAMN05216390_102254 [Lachnospiraceae bacterium KH1T2]|nr:hypothetical protein SAMN05216390_102254 [Lachnospiraceae bacterium KH1T2]